MTNVIEFEKEYGADALLKITISALNKLLVDRNLIGERELIGYLQQEMEIFAKDL